MRYSRGPYFDKISLIWVQIVDFLIKAYFWVIPDSPVTYCIWIVFGIFSFLDNFSKISVMWVDNRLAHPHQCLRSLWMTPNSLLKIALFLKVFLEKWHIFQNFQAVFSVEHSFPLQKRVYKKCSFIAYLVNFLPSKL